MSKELADKYFLEYVSPLPGLATAAGSLDIVTVSRLTRNYSDRDLNSFNSQWGANPISASPFNAPVWEQAVDDAIAKINAVAGITLTRTAEEEIANINYYLVDRLSSGSTRAEIGIDESYNGDDQSGINDWGLISYYFDTDQNQIRNTVLHEFVHALGAADIFSGLSGVAIQISSLFSDFVPPVVVENSEDSQRFTVVSNDPYGGSGRHSNELGISDIWAIQQLYGINESTAVGDDNYSFDEGTIFKPIWDAGGFDQLDFSNASGETIIDLRQGEFSSNRDAGGFLGSSSVIDNPANNIGIAFGAVIEDAIGGDQSDVIIGNLAGNILEGGDGDDAIFAGSNAYLRFADEGLSYIGDFIQDSTLNAKRFGDAAEDWDYSELNGGRPIEALGDDLIGGDGDDFLGGGDGNDNLDGEGGADLIRGGKGDDTLFSGDGDGDRLYGDEDNDTIIINGIGDKAIDGGTGDDTLELDQELIGGSAIEYAVSKDIDFVPGMTPSPTPVESLVVSAVISGASLTIKNVETLRGTDSADRIKVLELSENGGDGLVIDLLGNGGSDLADTLDLRGYAADDTLTIDLRGNLQTLSNNDGGVLQFKGVEGVLGSTNKDIIFASDTGDDIRGLEGRDTLIGGAKNDVLIGGLSKTSDDDEADTLTGGAGNDDFYVGNRDRITDAGASDKIHFLGQLLTGGEETEEDSDVYKGNNGETYILAGSSLTVKIGQSRLIIEDYQDRDAGIILTPAEDEDDDDSPMPDKAPDEVCPDPDNPDEPTPPLNPLRPIPRPTGPLDNPPISPIIFDLNGDGVQTIGLDESTTYFDLDGDGRAELTSFASPEDGLLALDRNGNGLIDDITELFGSETRDGFFELDQFLSAAEADGGVLSANGNLLTADDLRVWRDANSDGISQADELFTLGELNIAEIPRVGSTVPLDSNVPEEDRPEFFGFDPNGNRISSIGQGFFDDGTSFAVADIFFNNEPSIIRPSDIELDPILAVLPDLPGGARFSDLREVASENAALRDLLLNTVQNASSFSGTELRAAVENILFVWTGISDEQLESRGQFIDPEPLAVLERIFGQTFQQLAGTNAGTSNPGPSAAHELLQTYNLTLDSFVSQFASQIYSAQAGLASLGEFDVSQLLSSPFLSVAELNYNPARRAVSTPDFNALIETIVADIPDGSTADALNYIDLVGSALTGLRQDVFQAGQDFIVNGTDAVFETAVRDAFVAVDDLALREVFIARVLGAQRLVGTDAATETIDSDDPDLFRDLNGVSSILEGGAGNDTLIGGNGGDVYVFAPGHGLDRVEDGGSENRQIETSRPIARGGQSGNPGGVDRLIFLDRSVNDVSFSINGPNLILTFADIPNDSVLITDVLRDKRVENGIEQLIFSDGIIGEDDINQLIESGQVEFTSSLPSTPGDDIIEGTSGSNRYLLAEGIGNDTIIAGYFDTTVDQLVINFDRDEVILAVGNGGLLVTTTEQTTDSQGNSITVRGPDSVFFDDFSRPSGSQLFRYNLRGIQTLDNPDPNFGLLQEIDRDDTVFLANDFEGLELARGRELDGVVANSLGTQSNLFIVDNGAIVTDLGRQFSLSFEIGTNYVFGDGRILSREEVARLVPVVNFTPDQASVLNGSIFGETVVGGTQSDTINAGRGDDIIEAGEGDDDVIAGRGDDVIVGGLGDDRLVGDDTSSVGSFGSIGAEEVGSDTFLYSSGDGNDRIADFGTGQVDRDILVLNDLNFDDVVFSRVKDNDLRPESQSELPIFVPPQDRVVDNLLITDTSTGQTITVEGQFSNSVFGLEAIQFADGTLLEREELLAQIVLTDDVSDVSDGTTLSGRGLIYGGSQYSVIADPNGIPSNSDDPDFPDFPDFVAFSSIPNASNNTPLDLISLDQLSEADTAIFDSISISQLISGIEIVEFRDATSADVTISRDTAGTLFLTLNSTGQHVRADNFFSGGELSLSGEILGDHSSIGATSSLRFIKFSDGELFTVADIAERAVIAGGEGDDILEADGLGGRLEGGGGSDVIRGGANADQIDGGTGNDELVGGDGDDVFFARDSDGDDQIDGGFGVDTYDATFTNQGITVTLQDAEPDNGGGTPIGPGDPPDDPGDIVILLDPSDDDLGDPPPDPGDVVPLDPSDGNPGDGLDILPIDPRPVPPGAMTSIGTATSSDGAIDQLESIERVIGGRGDDVISGSSVDEEFVGNDGDDQLLGGAGDDLLAGGNGADTLDGGEGFDTADFSRARSGVALSLANGTGSLGEAAGDTFTGIEAVQGSSFADSVEADDQDNLLSLGRGDDAAFGAGGNDAISGGDGDDQLAGGTGNDELNGGNGSDVLEGGEGIDTLIGGLGNDTLAGGLGGDIYIVEHDRSDDIIDDGAGDVSSIDTIVLSELSQDQVTIQRFRDDLILSFEVFGSVTILNQFAGDGSGIELIEFRDGTSVNLASIAGTLENRPNGPVLAADDTGLTGVENSELTINAETLLANDRDLDGDALSITEINGASNGTATFDNDGNITFTPDANFFGLASFAYTVSDGFGATDTASVEIEFIEDQTTSGGYTIFRQDIAGSFFSVELVDEAPTYTVGGNTVDNLNAFLDAAVVAYGGVRERSGTIQEKALEHFGDTTNPGIRQRVTSDDTDVIISGGGVGGQYRAGFIDPASADAFEAFATDLLGKDPAQTEVFEFSGNTNGGSNTIRVFANDEIIALNGDGFSTPDSYLFEWSGADTAGKQRTTDHDTFITRMGELFGGTQESDANLVGFFGSTQASLTGDQLDKVTIAGNGADGAETWAFNSQSDAENFRDFYASLGSIAQLASQASELDTSVLSATASSSTNESFQSASLVFERIGGSSKEPMLDMRWVNQTNASLSGLFTFDDWAEILRMREPSGVSDLFNRFDVQHTGQQSETSQLRDDPQGESRDLLANGQRTHVVPEQVVRLDDFDAAPTIREGQGSDDAELLRKLMIIRQEMNTFGARNVAETERLRSDAPDYLQFYA